MKIIVTFKIYEINSYRLSILARIRSDGVEMKETMMGGDEGDDDGRR